MGAGDRPTGHEQNALDAAYPITRRSLERLRELVREAHGIAASVRDTGPWEVRFEASDLVGGIRDVDVLLRDLTTAWAMAETG